MSKKKTIAEVREEIAATEKKIEQGENLIAEKKQQYNKLARKERTRQLIQRGAILESLIDGADALDNEQIKMLLIAALSTSVIREMAKNFIRQNEANAIAEAQASLPI